MAAHRACTLLRHFLYNHYKMAHLTDHGNEGEKRNRIKKEQIGKKRKRKGKKEED